MISVIDSEEGTGQLFGSLDPPGEISSIRWNINTKFLHPPISEGVALSASLDLYKYY